MNRNKFTIGSKLFFAAMLFAFATFMNATAAIAASSASIKTAYFNGSVVVSGSGFDGGELVDLTIGVSGDEVRGLPALATWQVYTDKNGNFLTSFAVGSFVTPTGRFVVRASAGKTEIAAEVSLLPNPSADLDQCANGPFSAPVQCTGANWQNGNVGASSGHYYEGEAVPYRMSFDNLTISSSNTVTIEWDTTQGGKHAIDYLMSYNFTENTGNNPCSGVAGNTDCTNNTPTTAAIPLDPNVSGAGVTQIGGQVFTMWGGTITSVSAYSISGTYAGNSSTRITLTFTADEVNPVLAWGGHIAERADWASLGGSASDIPGSPYHMRLIELNGSGGNQDRSLSAVSIRLNSEIVIIKDAQPNVATPFGFTGSFGAFNLLDDGVTVGANTLTQSNLLGVGGSQLFTVTENSSLPSSYALTAINCTVTGTAGSSTVTSIPTRTLSITLNYGDQVKCTFINQVVTAASASVGGRVADAFGNPISRASVTLVNPFSGDTQVTRTNQFGSYVFNDVQVGEFYVVTVSSTRYTFPNATRTFTLDDAISDIDFTAEMP